MREIRGKYNTAKVFTDNCEDVCVEQIRDLLDQEPFRDSKIRIMPDCHAGKSCVIGFTADLGDKIIPNIVGVDIGCGMLTVELGKVEIDYARLDQIIRKYVPSGREVHEGRLMRFPKIQEMKCFRELIDTRKMERAIGSLGGGNHFIEIDVDDKGNKYLVIHTGSRKLGTQVCDIYQKKAIGIHTGKEALWDEEERIKSEYKAAGQREEIQDVLKELHRNFRQTPPDVPLDLCYLTGEYSQNYLHDMRICQEYADENRHMIAKLLEQIEANELDRTRKTEESKQHIREYIDELSNEASSEFKLTLMYMFKKYTDLSDEYIEAQLADRINPFVSSVNRKVRQMKALVPEYAEKMSVIENELSDRGIIKCRK